MQLTSVTIQGRPDMVKEVKQTLEGALLQQKGLKFYSGCSNHAAKVTSPPLSYVSSDVGSVSAISSCDMSSLSSADLRKMVNELLDPPSSCSPPSRVRSSSSGVSSLSATSSLDVSSLSSADLSRMVNELFDPPIVPHSTSTPRTSFMPTSYTFLFQPVFSKPPHIQKITTKNKHSPMGFVSLNSLIYILTCVSFSVCLYIIPACYTN